MRRLLTSLLLAFSLAAAAPASAGQFVTIEGGTQESPVRLIGYMARPPGEGPFPAVVLLHGCGGFHASMISWADRLSRWGYVTLAVDSFGPRGFSELCSGQVSTYQSIDGYAALRHLAGKSFVRASRVAVMGFSQGGWAVLETLDKGVMEHLFPHRFRAGIAFYPLCKYASGIMSKPVLVLAGGADTWTPASQCQAMAAGRSEPGSPRKEGDRSMVELVVYPGVHHGFDLLDVSLSPGRGITAHGHRVEYNEEAMRDAMRRVRAFLERTLD
ncbi:MAG: dienelactone hydrolase family protein [Alphaproteobacteria bacterium]|nr:dienelactone hydrolase family protein [Alphaproteobacteria bacterium]MCW5740756.1 dienelactone hydrolase family protein [Alphaproteobacteria bacterium]